MRNLALLGESDILQIHYTVCIIHRKTSLPNSKEVLGRLDETGYIHGPPSCRYSRCKVRCYSSWAMMIH